MTNRYITEEVNNPRPFYKWYKQTLEQHTPQGHLESLPSGETEIQSQIQNFFQSSGCTQLHGIQCFDRLQKQYVDQVGCFQDVVREIQRLVTSNKDILHVGSLKAILYQAFPSTTSYNSDNQEDAGIPFLHIMQCLPNLDQKVTIEVRKGYECLECKRKDERMDKEQFVNLAYSGQKKDLQNKIDKWSSNISDDENLIWKRCMCKLYINGKKVQDEKTVPSTPHKEFFEVVKAPQLLYKKRAYEEKSAPSGSTEQQGTLWTI